MISPGVAGASAGRLRSRSFGCCKGETGCQQRERSCAKCAKFVGCSSLVAYRSVRLPVELELAASTVRAKIRRFQAAGPSWPLPEELTDAALEANLFVDAGTKQSYRRQIEPDWASMHRELKRKHVTLSILWDEYVERNPEGYRYSRLCELYRS